jgi:hypothetical protein
MQQTRSVRYGRLQAGALTGGRGVIASLPSRTVGIAGLLLLVLFPAGCWSQPVAGQVAPDGPDPHIGSTFPPAPERVVITRGMTIGTADTARYAFAAVEEERRGSIWLGVSQAGARDRFRIVDVLRLPRLSDDERLVVGLCGRPRSVGRPLRFIEDLEVDPEIVAIARASDGPVFHYLVRAWGGRRSMERFEEVDASGWVCINEDYAELEPDVGS